MAIRDEIRVERDKARAKGKKAYLAWFWDYYHWPVIIGILVLLFFLYFLFHMLTIKTSVIDAYFINADDNIEAAKQEKVNSAFSKELGLEDGGRETTNLDLSVYISPGAGLTTKNMTQIAKIQTQFDAGRIDCFVIDAANFVTYVNQGYVEDLSLLLSKEDLVRYEKAGLVYYMDLAGIKKYREAENDLDEETAEAGTMDQKEAMAFEDPATFVTPDPSALKEPVPVGIILKDSHFLEDGDIYPDDVVPIFGFAPKARHPENAGKLLKFLVG